MKLIPIQDRFFEMIDGVMYVFIKAIKEAGLSVGYYKNLNSEGSDKTMLHPKNKKIILVRYDCISAENQQKIIHRFGCTPAEFICREPIRRMIKQHHEARQFFLAYRFNDEKILPIHRVKQYSRACDILQLIKDIDESRNKLIKDLSISVPQFYDHLKAIILEEQKNGESETYEGANQLYARFPYHYISLRDKVKEYSEKGYQCVIDKAYGNTGALKVKDEVAEAQLLTLIENPLQYDDVMICMMYNSWAASNNYKVINPSTVGNWRRKKAYLVDINRYGNSAYNEKHIREVKGLPRTSLSPLKFVEHDDNNLDFLFQDKEGYQFNKYVAIVVNDSCVDYILGKSYVMAQTPLTEQVYHAYMDAMYNVRRLTGGWHLPFEIKTDKWRSSRLTPFYEKIATTIPPAVGNKHRGYIEQLFGTPHFKRSQKLVSQDNWSGNNMGAKFRGVNPDMLKYSLDHKTRPMIGNEAELLIENFFHLMRNMPDFKREDMNAKSKEEQWLERWANTHKDDKRPITDEQFLLTFGITHKPKHTDGIRITNRGIEPQIKNGQYSYDLPEAWMYQKLRGAKVEVIYDPYDMSRVLCTNHDDIRFVAQTAQLIPRAIHDHYTGSRTFLNAILSEKTEQVKKVTAESEKRKALVDTRHYNAEAMLQGGVMIKELKNEAEQKLIEGFNQEYENYLDTNTDFNAYL